MQRDETLVSLSVHWGIILKIFLYLCQMEIGEKQEDFAKPQTGSRAFYGSCSQIRSAILRASRTHFLGHFFWAGDARLIELLDHPHNLANFFYLNAKLNWLSAYLGRDQVTTNDIYCLSGRDYMIQKVLDSRSTHLVTPADIRRYCLLTLMSECPAAIRFYCASMRIQAHYLLPALVQKSYAVVKKNLSTQLKESMLYELCLYGNSAAWECLAAFVTEKAIKDYIKSSILFDVLLSDANESQLMHPHSLRALLKYCDPLSCEVALLDFRNRMIHYGRPDLVNVLLEFARPKSKLTVVNSVDLRTIVKSGYFSLLKKVLLLNPRLLQQVINPAEKLGFDLVCALFEAQTPNLAILNYLCDELKIKLDGQSELGSKLFMAVFQPNDVLALLLKYFPGFVKSKNYNKESPLQYLLKRSVVAWYEYGNPKWRDWCFANVMSLVGAGADPFEAFNLQLNSYMAVNIGFMTLYQWPLFNEAMACLINAGLDLNAMDSNQFTVSYVMLLCYGGMSESTLSLILRQPINVGILSVQQCLDDAFNKACATCSPSLAQLFIAKGAALRCDRVARPIDFNFIHSDSEAESRYAQFCHELREGEEFTVTGLTGLDLAVINARSEVVRVIIENIPREDLLMVLTTTHLNNKKSTYDLAIALNNREIIHTIDCLLESMQTFSFSAGI